MFWNKAYTGHLKIIWILLTTLTFPADFFSNVSDTNVTHVFYNLEYISAVGILRTFFKNIIL